MNSSAQDMNAPRSNSRRLRMPRELREEREVTTYCEDLYSRTRALWRSLEGQYPTWKCRFSILYGPPVFRPDLLIVGSNPGFNADDLYDEEILTWPGKNEYTNKNWPLATKLRSIFSDAGLEAVLEKSLGTNQLFFKSKGVDRHETGLGWADNPLDVRRQLEAYCAHELERLVRELEPNALLTLGLSVFDDIADVDRRDITSAKGRRVASVGSAYGTTIIGVIHPTGAQVSNEDWALVVSALSAKLGSKSQLARKPVVALGQKQPKQVSSAKTSPKKGSSRQPPFRPDSVVKAAKKPPATFGYQPINDFWQELSQLGEVTVEDFHRHMLSTGWRRPQGGALTYEVTRTDIACMCREGFAARVDS